MFILRVNENQSVNFIENSKSLIEEAINWKKNLILLKDSLLGGTKCHFLKNKKSPTCYSCYHWKSNISDIPLCLKVLKTFSSPHILVSCYRVSRKFKWTDLSSWLVLISCNYRRLPLTMWFHSILYRLWSIHPCRCLTCAKIYEWKSWMCHLSLYL